MSEYYQEFIAKLQRNKSILTCKGMSSVNWDCSDSEFEFVFGEDRVCRVHSVMAEFLSPKVARLRKCDPLSGFYTIKDSELFDVFESLVLSLRSGDALQVEESNFAGLLRLSQELENADLLSSLIGMIDTESVSLEAIVLLREGIDLGAAFSDQFGNLRDFIASRFYEIEKEILDDLDLETSQILLSSPSLRLEDENSLYDFVRSRSENDLRFTSLFEFVYFEYLSVDRIENFSSFVSENLLENLNSGIWRQICRGLTLKTKPNEKNPHDCRNNDTGREFVYEDSKKLDGIIAHLTRECGGNVHDLGIVNVTASSFQSGYHPKNAVDLRKHAAFDSQDEPNSWICYEFKARSVIPTSYSVRSWGYGPGSCHLKSWVIEVSNDKVSWTEIDRQDNNNNLNDKYVTRNFTISQVPSESFRFVRLRQTGKSHSGYDFLTLSALEIFGTLHKDK